MTKLAGREKTVYLNEHATLLPHFAFQKIQKLAYRRIREGAREAPILDESFDMQVLYCYNAAGLCDLGCHLVEPVQSDTGNLIVEAA